MCGVRIAALLPASRWRGLGGPAGDIAVAHSPRMVANVFHSFWIVALKVVVLVAGVESQFPRAVGIGRVLRTGPVPGFPDVREQARVTKRDIMDRGQMTHFAA